MINMVIHMEDLSVDYSMNDYKADGSCMELSYPEIEEYVPLQINSNVVREL